MAYRISPTWGAHEIDTHTPWTNQQRIGVYSYLIDSLNENLASTPSKVSRLADVISAQKSQEPPLE
jgi:hypothetical protein